MRIHHALVVAGLASVAAVSYADKPLFWTEVNSWAGAYRGSTPPAFEGNGNPFVVLLSTGNRYDPGHVNQPASSSFNNGSFSAASEGFADFGTLKAKANFSGTGRTVNPGDVFVTSGSTAYSQFADTFTFNGPNLSKVELNFNVTGLATATGAANAAARFHVAINEVSVFDGDLSGPFAPQIFFDVNPNTPYLITTTLTTYAQVRQLESSPGTSVTGTGDSNFFNTATLTSLKGYTSNFTAIDLQTSTASGHVYGPVPEPASFAVVGLGLAAFLRRRRTR